MYTCIYTYIYTYVYAHVYVSNRDMGSATSSLGNKALHCLQLAIAPTYTNISE